MIAYCRRVASCRFFWLSLVAYDIRQRYRWSIIGVSWALLQPAMLAAVISVVFGRAFGVGFFDFFLYVLSGLCFWNFVTYVTSGGCQSIRSGETYILQHRLPLAIYPLRWTMVAAFHFLMAMVPVFILSAATGVLRPDALLFVPFTFLFLLIFGWSVATIFGIANMYFPDTLHLTQIGTTVLFYSTPIIWRPEMLRARNLGWIVDYNPLAAFVEVVRNPLLDTAGPSTAAMLKVVAAVAVCFMLATLMLAKCERKIAFHF